MVSPASPLPKNPYSTPSEGRWHDAYDMCLKIEPALADPLEEDAVHARLLGYLILEAPTPAGRDYISEEILNCEGNTAKLSELVKFFVSSVMPVCELYILSSFIGFNWIPVQKRHYKYESNPRKFLNLPVEATPQNYRYAKRAVNLKFVLLRMQTQMLFSKALSRDHYRCLMSDTQDMDYLDILDPSTQLEWLNDPGACSAVTIAWHIIPPLFVQGSSPDRASTFILNYCSIPNELIQRPYDLTNILTLASNIASRFTRLHVWLEAIPVRTSCPLCTVPAITVSSQFLRISKTPTRYALG